MNKAARAFINIFILLTVCSAGLPARAQRFPEYSGYVNDYAGVLENDDEAEITALASEVEQKTGAQIAVVTVATVKPETIEQYAVSLFEKWGIGQKGKDNGVLILMAVNDREVRIEVGYGLEGALTDAMSSAIIRQVMIPRFKAGGYSKGLLSGSAAAADIIAKEYNVEITGLESMPVKYYRPGPASMLTSLLRGLLLMVFFVAFFGLRTGLLFYWLFGTGRRRGGYWYGTGYHGGGGGGFSGGFGGFGGGMSGGGGASGGW